MSISRVFVLKQQEFCACSEMEFSELSLLETLCSALQVSLHVATPLLGMLVPSCQISLQFSVPYLKAELLRLWLSPRCPSSRDQCPWAPAVLQHNLLYSSRNDTALCAVLVLTSSGGEDSCPQVPGGTGVGGCAGAGQVL